MPPILKMAIAVQRDMSMFRGADVTMDSKNGEDGFAGSWNFAKGEALFFRGPSSKEQAMSIEGKAKEAAGFVKEEAFEHGKSPESKEKAQEGRDLRNEGRIEDGKAPKTTEPGTGAKE